MGKRIVTLSDTSHPFTVVTDDEPKTDRTVTQTELDAVREFATDWGYHGHYAFMDGLVDILADTSSDRETLVRNFLREWDLMDESDEQDARDGILELLKLRDSVITNQLRRQHFFEERDARVNRFFIGPMGEAWIVHHIVDIPLTTAQTPPLTRAASLEAKDGMRTMVHASLHFTYDAAQQSITDSLAFIADMGDSGELSHVVHLHEI